MENKQCLKFSKVSVKLGEAQILHDVTGCAKSGEVLAIMGPSGSGKTTLLNSISGRIKTNSGEITLGEVQLDKFIRRRLSYVLQHDIFFANLTMRETIYFAAMLKLPSDMPRAEKMKRIDDVVDALKMRSCLDTVVGSAIVRGLSGGERKRVNIACELVMNPDILLLDEPTSGLDSYTAHTLMMQLKEYATSLNKIIITTIHQPSSQIFYSFNKLLLMAKGHVVYFGEGKDVLSAFEKIGFKCAQNYNPADFILQTVNSNEEDLKLILEKTKSTKDRLKDNPDSGVNKAFVPDEVPKIKFSLGSEVKKSELDSGRYRWVDPEMGIATQRQKDNERHRTGPKWPSSFCTQYRLLTWRHFQLSRSYFLSKLELFQMIMFSLIAGALWFQIDRTDVTVRDTLGLMNNWDLRGQEGYHASTAQCPNVPGPSHQCGHFPAEMPVINKERAAGMYRLSAYILAKMTSELPLVITFPTVCYPIIYWMAGLNSDVSTFFGSLGVTLICAMVGQSAGFLIGAAFNRVDFALTAASLYFLTCLLLGGFFTRTMPFWLEWSRFLSVHYYAYRAFVILEFTDGYPIRCVSTDTSPLSACDRLLTNGTFLNETAIIQSAAVLHDEETTVTALFIMPVHLAVNE
ncbi:uncharacterized protein LOC135475778 [Liolophura sinensis]|uniref:uncharacterized protein LOC135475778 n=1 Tax=Liolophura sinensis TaxID=3198878 RepID=UPI003158C397